MSDRATTQETDERSLAIFLLGCSLGAAAGMAIPTWMVGEVGDGQWRLVTALVLVLLMALCTVLSARILGRRGAGLLFVAAGLLLGVLLFVLTWFTFTPGILVGCWLVAGGLTFWRQHTRDLTLLLILGAATLIPTVASSLNLVSPDTLDTSILIGTVLNATAFVILALAALIRSRRASSEVEASRV